MTAHSIAAHNDTTIVCICGVVIPCVNTRYAQRMALYRHADRDYQEGGDDAQETR